MMRNDVSSTNTRKQAFAACWRGFLGLVRATRRQRTAVLIAAFLTSADPSRAGTTALPVALEATLLAKMVAYDRNFSGRATGRVRVVLAVKANHSDSAKTATEMRIALEQLPSIGGLPHEEALTTYAGPKALADTCRLQRASIVFIGPGFEEDVDGIREALTGMSILSVAGVPDYVPHGIVLGFDVIAGRPKMLVNVAQARRQNVDFRVEVLRLAQVFR